MTWSEKSSAFIALKPSSQLKRHYICLCLLAQITVFYNALPLGMQCLIAVVMLIFSICYGKHYIVLSSPNSLKKISLYADYLLLTQNNFQEKRYLLENVTFTIFHQHIIFMQTSERSYFILKQQLGKDDFHNLIRRINLLQLEPKEKK